MGTKVKALATIIGGVLVLFGGYIFGTSGGYIFGDKLQVNVVIDIIGMIIMLIGVIFIGYGRNDK